MKQCPNCLQRAHDFIPKEGVCRQCAAAKRRIRKDREKNRRISQLVNWPIKT